MLLCLFHEIKKIICSTRIYKCNLDCSPTTEAFLMEALKQMYHMFGIDLNCKHLRLYDLQEGPALTNCRYQMSDMYREK